VSNRRFKRLKAPLKISYLIVKRLRILARLWIIHILSFYFFKNGSLTNVYDGNVETAGKCEDDIAKTLYENSNESATSWVKGYRLAVRIIEKSFTFKVPQSPKKVIVLNSYY
jgi:hypothetical protein